MAESYGYYGEVNRIQLLALLLLCSQTMERSGLNGRAGGTQTKKWLINQDSKISMSIHPLSLRPYMVPGTSPMVRSGFSIFLSNMTSGGIAYPPALQQDKTVNN